MSQDHEKSSPDTPVSDGIHPEAAPFEPGYQPGTLPQIKVPDLAEDAEGLSAEALANVPTLTELVEAEDVSEEVQADHAEVIPVAEQTQASVSSDETEAFAQDEPAQADTWGEQLQARMGKLSDDIHTLNVRLDRLEERNKTKV